MFIIDSADLFLIQGRQLPLSLIVFALGLFSFSPELRNGILKLAALTGKLFPLLPGFFIKIVVGIEMGEIEVGGWGLGIGRFASLHDD